MSCVVFAGCSTATVEHTGAAIGAPAGSGEAIVLLGDEAGIPACVHKVIQNAATHLEFVSSVDFQNALFPWFEASTAPRTTEELALLLNEAKIQERIESMNVRYVIVVSGRTTKTDPEGPIIGGVSPAGGGFIGFTKWNKDTHISAIVWDLGEVRKAETLEVNVAGTAVVIAFGLPLPIIPATETEACNLLGNRLAKLLADNGRPEN